MKKIFIALLVLLSFNPCFAKPKAEKNKANVVVAQNRGKGLRSTVPAPRTRGLTEADDWAAQVVQDLMTQGLSEYTEMTVIDRANEALVIEEQKRSERGEYSDSDYLEMGKITQAQYLLVGSIVNAGGVYRLALSVNDGTTNEIKASFNESVTLDDIQSGKATNAALLKLITAMNFDLTESEKERLSKTPVAASNTVNLAKGMAAEARSNTIEALSYYANSNADEAAVRYDKITTAVKTGNIREDAKNDIEERAAWVKLFTDLQNYIDNNAIYFYYDVNPLETVTDYNTETVSIPFEYTYGLNRIVLDLYEKIISGLLATGKAEKWSVDDVFSIDVPSFVVSFELKNASGKLLVKESVTCGYKLLAEEIERIASNAVKGVSSKKRTVEYIGKVVFDGVAYQDITDSLSLNVTEINVKRGRFGKNIVAKNPPIEVIAFGADSGVNFGFPVITVDANDAAETIENLTENATVKVRGKHEQYDFTLQNAVDRCKVQLELDLSEADVDTLFIGVSNCSSLVSLVIPKHSKLPLIYNCPNLSSIKSTRSKHIVIDGVLYKSKKELVLAPRTIEELVIPEGVEKIDRLSLCYCQNLKSVTIPLSVKEIGYRAFDNCTALTEVKYAGSAEQWKKIKIDKDGNKLLLKAAKKCIK